MLAFGIAIGGRPGARLLPEVGSVVSGDRLLRAVVTVPLPVASSPRILGVDDWSLRKRHTCDSSICVATGADPNALAGELREFLELAAAIGAPQIRVFGGPWPDGRAAREIYDTVAALLNAVAPDAERRGVAIVLETHDTLASARAVAVILERVPSRAIGALWDAHHPYRMGEQPDEVLTALGARLLHFHVKDARRNEVARTGWDLLLLGKGENPVESSLKARVGSGYDGWVAVEWEKKWHLHIAEPEVALPRHAHLLRAWLDAGGDGRQGPDATGG